MRHYGKNCVVVFDNYPEDVADRSTKNVKRIRRKQKCLDPEMEVREDLLAITQVKFLSNDKNKSNLISLLRRKMNENSI